MRLAKWMRLELWSFRSRLASEQPDYPNGFANGGEQDCLCPTGSRQVVDSDAEVPRI